jgi:hypothetical protein
MRRPSPKSLFAFAAASLAAGALPSCATNDSMMYIVGVVYREAGSCTVKADLEAAILAKGRMDRLLTSEYTAALMVGNQLTQRGSRERLRTETSKVALKGAEVRLENTQGKLLAPEFSAIGTGFVDASEGVDAGPAAMFVTIIPASIAGSLERGTVVSKVRVFGTTLGGEDVESAELLFPIEVCDGCLVTFPASARDLTADGDTYQCLLATDDTASSPTADEALPCRPGVDLAVPCTSCSGLYDFCRTPDKNCAYNADACDP